MAIAAKKKPLFRYADGLLPNSLAMAYTLTAWFGGLALLFASSPWLNALGTLLLAHGMIMAAYFIHEFAHGSIFSKPRHNEWAGNVCSWMSGSCYARFADLRHKHMRHHVDRADVITFDSKAFLKARPVWFQKLVLMLEWAYVPAVELIMHFYVILMPFITDHEKHRVRRGQVAAVFGLRAFLFALLGWFSLKALLLYGVAWMIMLTVLRFADAYQHTYDAFAVLGEGKVPDDKLRDRRYEQQNTFTNVVSLRWPALNLLLLNFSYHNVHHEKPAEPWYRLPALHAKLYGSAYAQVIPMRALLPSFHKHRLRRVLDDDYGVVVQGQPDHFYGAVGVSFLTAV
ncbi:fatty acid desaturase family protein [Stutzerimonas tarimensis]|uniref:Fatty acid desaturase family protein n=1 Tax=Stutzerimonas tarimensis TaxID=1507735 RepID=A0ABV7T5L7_9GAMM